MKQYPSISHWDESLFGRRVWAFDKLDGSNLRAEWSRKRGWYKFGTRNEMIDENHKYFGNAVTVFLGKYGESLPRIFTDNRRYRGVRNFVVFCEYLGENSFAGAHAVGDVMDTVLFEVNPVTKGFLKPEDFMSDFGHLHVPRLIYSGELNEKFVDDVRNGAYPVNEGVVAKGVERDKQVWLVKIKTKSWLEELKKRKGQKALDEEFNGSKIKQTVK